MAWGVPKSSHLLPAAFGATVARIILEIILLSFYILLSVVFLIIYSFSIYSDFLLEIRIYKEYFLLYLIIILYLSMTGSFASGSPVSRYPDVLRMRTRTRFYPENLFLGIYFLYRLDSLLKALYYFTKINTTIVENVL